MAAAMVVKTNHNLHLHSPSNNTQMPGNQVFNPMLGCIDKEREMSSKGKGKERKTLVHSSFTIQFSLKAESMIPCQRKGIKNDSPQKTRSWKFLVHSLLTIQFLLRAKGFKALTPFQRKGIKDDIADKRGSWKFIVHSPLTIHFLYRKR